MLTDTPSLQVDLRPSNAVGEMIRAIDKILPEETIQKFEGIAQEEERVQWQKGDLTNEIWSAVLAANLCNGEGKPYTFMDICYYVSRRFLRGGRSENTVKAWALTARRFPPALRKRYRWLDIPFSHFTYAGRNKFDADNPKTGHKFFMDILDYSWELSQNQGYPAAEWQLKSVFEPEAVSQSSGYVQYQTGVNVGSGIEFAPLNIERVSEDPEPPEVDYEAELREQLHRLNLLIQGISVNNPKIGKMLFQALSMMWNVIGGR